MAADLSGAGPASDQELVPEDDRIIGRVFRWSVLLSAVVALVVLSVLFLRPQPKSVATVVPRGAIQAPAALDQRQTDIPDVRFTDVTREAGVEFVHVSGATGEKLLPETMGSGAAFFDADVDGDPDLLLVNAARWPGQPGPPSPAALYRNDGTGHFADVTAGSGLDVTLYGQGVAVGDYDGDGRVDVFLAALGPDRLFRNTAEGFRDVTDSAGVAGSPDSWSTSAGFFDYDGDSDLDLFVCNYVRWSRETDLKLHFTLNGVDRAYGQPRQYEGTNNCLYRNEGGGRFSDVSAESGIQVEHPATGLPMGKALGMTFADVDDDGDLDVIVANDTVQKFAFRNRGDGTFEEVGAMSGLAFDNLGSATGAMGIDIGDFANDGTLAVGIGNFANESTSFYVQRKGSPWQFVDVADAAGIGSPSRLRLSFGLLFLDYDLDGRLDLLQANGHIEDAINQIQPSQTYRQAAQLFWNCSSGERPCYVAVAEENLGDLARPIVGRGAAYADIDGDGDLDLLLTQTGDRPLLLRNDQALGHHWLRLRLVGAGANRDAIGARVRLTAGGVTQERQVMPSRSYLSQVELPLTFGLGSATRVDALRIHWPNGATLDLEAPGVDRLIEVAQAP